MKSIYFILLISLLSVSCKSDKTETTITTPKKELTVAQKIANAHGFENWKNVTEVKFTFAVDRDTIKGNGRFWTWQPKNNYVVHAVNKDSILMYTRTKMDSRSIKIDRYFINDKYWAFAPFQLVWDTDTTISEAKKAEAPISKTQMDMITILYPNEGGYTPGDAYDIYYDENYIIKEWAYRSKNSEKISLANTFEDYQDYNGIKIATNHKKDGGKWNLNLTNIKVKTD